MLLTCRARLTEYLALPQPIGSEVWANCRLRTICTLSRVEQLEQLHETQVLIGLSTDLADVARGKPASSGSMSGWRHDECPTIRASSMSQSESVKPFFQFRQQSLMTLPEGLKRKGIRDRFLLQLKNLLP
jgi:hypothetical protein